MTAPCCAALLAVVLGACFNPDYPVGLPCGPDRFCPDGQTCSAQNICESDDAPPPDASADIDARPRIDADLGLGDLQSIDIGPDLDVPINQLHTFVVTGTYDGGERIEDNIFVIWQSSNNATAFVDFMGVLHPQAEGTVTITADFEGRVDTADITVVPAM